MAYREQILGTLNESLRDESIRGDAQLRERERASKRVRITMQGVARKKLGMEGEVKMFGSFSNGFKTGTSDLDVVFLTKVTNETIIPVLGQFAKIVPDVGFENVTKIFNSNVPLLKITDRQSGMEVDFCINNELGVRNSQLLLAYCRYDERVLRLGRLVKDWAKRHELVGTTDGCLNGYAYMLLVIHFLQQLDPPVVPNLQALATEPFMVIDNKWGCEDHWDTKFVEDVDSLPKSDNNMSLGELILDFFWFYGSRFDWKRYAVCMRLAQSGQPPVEKASLLTATMPDQWHVEDPFDLKHNLAGKCTAQGRERIQEQMRHSFYALSETGQWPQACPTVKSEQYFLKCRISSHVTPQALLEEFEPFDLVKLHFPKPDENGRRMGQAFLEFGTAAARRKAHTRNEFYVGDSQLQLHYSSENGLREALQQGPFGTFEMASYKMQRQVMMAAKEQLPGASHHSQQQQQQQQPPQDLRGRPDWGHAMLMDSPFGAPRRKLQVMGQPAGLFPPYLAGPPGLEQELMQQAHEAPPQQQQQQQLQQQQQPLAQQQQAQPKKVQPAMQPPPPPPPAAQSAGQQQQQPQQPQPQQAPPTPPPPPVPQQRPASLPTQPQPSAAKRAASEAPVLQQAKGTKVVQRETAQAEKGSVSSQETVARLQLEVFGDDHADDWTELLSDVQKSLLYCSTWKVENVDQVANAKVATVKLDVSSNADGVSLSREQYRVIRDFKEWWDKKVGQG